jgi:hypothetical protein
MKMGKKYLTMEETTEFKYDELSIPYEVSILQEII